MYINACLACHPGKVREKNEDNFLFFDATLENINNSYFHEKTTVLDRPILLGVFDGMGGISAGEKASHIAAQTALHLFQRWNGQIDYEQLLGEICHTANNQICQEMQSGVKKRMGTTASMLCFLNGNFFLCNIGDSPIFIYRNGRLVEISHEHTERENYETLYGQALDKRKKYKLTQHLGIFPEEMEIEPNIVPGQSKPNDRYLICSDGLTDMVNESEIEKVLSRGLLGEATQQLMNMALNNGGKDNITMICIEVCS